jgi:hypothetical protein
MSELTADQVAWLRGDRRGASSEALFERLTGHVLCEESRRTAHPYDPADLARCILMLEQCGLTEHLGKARDLSPTWRRLIDAWLVLVSTFDEEVPGWRAGRWRTGAVRVYELMKVLTRGG